MRGVGSEMERAWGLLFDGGPGLAAVGDVDGVDLFALQVGGEFFE